MTSYRCYSPTSSSSPPATWASATARAALVAHKTNRPAATTRAGARPAAALNPRAQYLYRDLRDLCWVAPHAHALRLERLGLRGRRALRAGDDRAGVAHRLPGRRREPGDVGEHRLRHALGDVVGRLLLRRAADLAAHDDQLGLGVGLEQFDDVDEARARHGVAADADDRRVAEATLGDLVADLVGQRPRARHQPDVALLEELRRDDPDVGLAGRQDAGAVRADQARGAAAQVVVHPQLVVGGDALGDRD